MFQFPWFPLPALYIQAGVTRHDPCQVIPFGNPRIKACLAAPRGLSQPATSFIGFQRQGIHLVPFTTCRDDARARYEVLNDHHHAPTGADTPHPNRRDMRYTKDADTPPESREKARNRNLQSCTVCPTLRPSTRRRS
jgi:hypothetical protein